MNYYLYLLFDEINFVCKSNYIIIVKFLKNQDIKKCHVPNFALGHNVLITFSIFMRVPQIDAKGQLIANEENY